MKRPLSPFLLAAALLGAAGAARADNGSAGAEPFAFLQLDSSARSAALGGAYTALASDANALQYNPGGLGMVRQNEAQFMYNQYFQSASQEHGEVALTDGLGASYDLLNYGNLARTTYSSPNGGLGTFSVQDSALAAGYGHAFGSLSLGVAAKWVRENNAGTVGQTVAGDAGALWAPEWLPGLRLGAAAQNLGDKVRFQSDDEILPYTGRFGAAYSFRAFGEQNLVTAEADKAGSAAPTYSFGVETVAGGSLALRVGYTTDNETGLGLTAGFGWSGKQWSVDYAIAPYGDLGLTNRISVGVRWGGPKPVMDPLIADALRASAGRPPAARAPAPEGDGGPAIEGSPAPAPREPTAEDRIERAGLMIDAARLDDAEAELAAADRLLPIEDPLRVDWREARGRLCRARKDLSGARAEFGQSLTLALKLGKTGQVVADAYEGMGLTLADQGQLDYAVKFLRKAQSLRPRRDLEETIERYERRLQSSP